jgi:type II secretory pathway component GspD/PulD (secretin)
MPPIARVLLLVASSLSLPLGASGADSPVETVRLTLKELKPEDALGMLRVMVDARRLSMGDEHSVGITDRPATIELARKLIEMVEDPRQEAPRRLEIGDGTVIASVRLRHAPVGDVGSALRAKADVARIAMNVPLSTVVVRDSPERIEAALALIRELDTGQ